MKFVTYIHNGIEEIGVLNSEENIVLNLNQVLGFGSFTTMNEFISICNDELINKIHNIIHSDNIEGISTDSVKLCAPITVPIRSVICLGLNYHAHVIELKDSLGNERKVPDYPVYFSKVANRIIGSNEYINSHKEITDEVDYEVELAVIIGKEGINIEKDKVEEYIFGYSILNDITARDLQKKHTQWTRGKGLDTFTAMGPAIVHKSQLPLPLSLDLYSKVNGEMRQNSNTKYMMFDIPYIISDISKGLTLKPGDIIATGTPAGVGKGFNPPKLLKIGDIVECHIDKIGTLINIVK
ncbi:fumarylacetoacetate hydrolase family protein [Serpentinicella alkaliphila]|uniref:2-keto-4-pentenoate hydratase/2-oxohepta-3-ene-1,7-dioic acid hydratase in catechol pathway n=1 Tax=Serpentinicella alkaliphila TaxID=1734049 RepID=A0A4R2TLW8_9FIRM|nr:fumarylacetoacetate hydrolase family protein [Serpentinicella alkaliphila]QUH24544.1 fumarylacetoacetate hydrolase family protein [Serpentinicella alkaliphila]TCQ04638.1 2-keto-4-pentenoate hydratase/2-oxohepta-3-ene-1,7-dioic acid hydratase in catechol pathway [Serpentinicella alkaliphila]